MIDIINYSQEIINMFKRCKMPSALETYLAQAEDPNSCIRAFDERLYEILNSEITSRDNKKFNRLLKKASLRFPEAMFDEKLEDPSRKINLDVISHVSNPTWINEGRNLLITGKCGCGKTHIACAIAVSALKHNYTAFYIRCSDFIREYEAEQIEKREAAYFEYLAKVDLLILDDFGLMKREAEFVRILLDVIDARFDKKPTIVTSQYPVSEWYNLFTDKTYANACLDRLIKKALRLTVDGDSLRERNTSI